MWCSLTENNVNCEELESFDWMDQKMQAEHKSSRNSIRNPRIELALVRGVRIYRNIINIKC